MRTGVDRPDNRVHDLLALDEIELYGDLVIAASESPGPLGRYELDRVLGLADDLGRQQRDE